MIILLVDLGAVHEAGATPERGAVVRGDRHADEAVPHSGTGRRRRSLRLHHAPRQRTGPAVGQKLLPTGTSAELLPWNSPQLTLDCVVWNRWSRRYLTATSCTSSTAIWSRRTWYSSRSWAWWNWPTLVSPTSTTRVRNWRRRADRWLIRPRRSCSETPTTPPPSISGRWVSFSICWCAVTLPFRYEISISCHSIELGSWLMQFKMHGENVVGEEGGGFPTISSRVTCGGDNWPSIIGYKSIGGERQWNADDDHGLQIHGSSARVRRVSTAHRSDAPARS